MPVDLTYLNRFKRALLCACALAGVSTSSYAQESSQPLDAKVAAGGGIAHRDIELPTRAGRRRLDTFGFPAVELELLVQFRVSEHVRIGLESHYQTSIGLVVTSETLQAKARGQSGARAHRADVGATATIHFDSTPAGGLVRLFAGWALRGLHSTARVDVPAYGLGGPVLRPELEVAIARGAARLALAPELIVVVAVGDQLRDASDTASSGFGLGGELRLIVPASTWFDVGIAYRESHVIVDSPWSTDLTDTERFGTAQLALRY